MFEQVLIAINQWMSGGMAVAFAGAFAFGFNGSRY